MNSSETKRTPIRLTGLQVTDISVFEAFQADLQDFRDRIDDFEETLETVSGLEDAEGLINDVSLIKARLLDISAGLGIMQDTDAIIAGSIVDVSSYAHGLVIPVIPSAVSYFDNDAGYLTSHQDISGLASKAALNDVSVYAHSLVIPEIPSNVSAFTNDAGYLTSHQDISGLATRAALNDVSAYAHSIQVSETYDDTEIRSAIEDVSVYARSIEIPVVPTKVSDLTNDAGYLTQHQSLRGLATDASLQEVADSIPEAYDDTSLAQAIDDVSTYARSLATDASLQEVVDHADSGDASVVDYIDTEIGGNLDQVLDGSLNDGFATISWVERTVQGMIPGSVSAFFNDAGYLTEHQSLEGLITDASLAEALGAVDVSIAALDTSLQQVAASIPQVPAYISNFINDAGYLTEHQSLEGLATDASLAEVKALIPAAPDVNKSYVDTQDASLKTYIDTEIGGRIDEVLDGSLAGFATRDYVDQQIAGITPSSVENYDDTSITAAILDVSSYAHNLVIPVVPQNVSAFTNDAGYLTQHQSLEGLATDASLAEVAAGIPEAYDDTSLINYIDNEIGDGLDDILDDSQLSGFATKTYVDAAIADISTGGQAYDDTSLTQAVDDISAYAHGLVIPTVPSNVSAFTNDAGYLDASTLDASIIAPALAGLGAVDTVLDEILTGTVTQIDASLLDILGEDVQE
jgi:hypothetical protein